VVAWFVLQQISRADTSTQPYRMCWLIGDWFWKWCGPANAGHYRSPRRHA
jgi:hypothetical protein